MFKQMDIEEKELFLRGLQLLKCMKILQKNHFKIEENIVYIDVGDGYYDIQDFWDNTFKTVCGGNAYYDEFVADPESATLYDYKLPFDMDECGVYHLDIMHPAICAYLNELRKKRNFKASAAWKKFQDMVYDLVNCCCNGDYVYYEAFITTKSKGIIILCTDFFYFDNNTLNTLLEVIKFCKKKLKEKNISYE